MNEQNRTESLSDLFNSADYPNYDREKSEHLSLRSHSDFEAAHSSFQANVRMLSVINGGAALAMIGLLGQLATTAKDELILNNAGNIISSIAVSVVVLCMGLIAAGFALLCHSKSKHSWAKSTLRQTEFYEDPEKERIRKLELAGIRYQNYSLI